MIKPEANKAYHDERVDLWVLLFIEAAICKTHDGRSKAANRCR